MIKLSDVHFQHCDKDNKSQWQVVFDLTVKPSEKIAIVGASGAGKSTLLNLIAGFALPKSGTIWLTGKDYTNSQPYKRPVSILFQDNNLFNHLTVRQNISLGISPNLKLTAIQQQTIETIAEQVGLQDYLSRFPAQLSGGQQQRIALARCMIRNQPILLLDEPFSALDANLRLEMLALLDEICREKQLTLLMVTHQLEEVKNFVDKITYIDNGRIIA